MINQVVRSLGFKLRVHLAQQDGAGGGGAGQRAVQGQERFVLIHGEDAAAHKAQVDVAGHSAQHADDGKRNDEAGDEEGIEVDGGDGGDDHDVKHEAGDAVHHEIVDVIALHDAGFAQLEHNGAHQNGKDGAKEELEAPHHGLNGLAQSAQHAGIDEGVDALHEQEGQNVGNEHQRHLNGELVHGFGQRHFIAAGVLIKRHVVHGVLAGLAAEAALAAQIAQVHHAAQRGANKAHGGNRKAEAGAVGKTVGGFIGVAPGVGLSGTLAIAHGQQDAGGEEAADGVVEDDGHGQTEECLQQIGAHNRDAGVKGAGLGAVVLLLVHIAQRHGGKAKAQTMVGEDFQRAGLVQLNVEAVFEDGIHNQQDESAQHRGGNHQPAQRRNGGAQRIGNEHGAEEQRHGDHKVPHRGIPEVHSCRHKYRLLFC